MVDRGARRDAYRWVQGRKIVAASEPRITTLKSETSALMSKPRSRVASRSRDFRPFSQAFMF